MIVKLPITSLLTQRYDNIGRLFSLSYFLQDCPKCNICIEKNGGCNHMQVCVLQILLDIQLGDLKVSKFCKAFWPQVLKARFHFCSHCVYKSCSYILQCYNCKHDFCWMCLGDWRSHGSEYYECSRYKVLHHICICVFFYLCETSFKMCTLQENPNIANESAHAQAREALKKYLHYFERVSLKYSWYSPTFFNFCWNCWEG